MAFPTGLTGEPTTIKPMVFWWSQGEYKLINSLKFALAALTTRTVLTGATNITVAEMLLKE